MTEKARPESLASVSSTGTELFEEKRPAMVARESSDTLLSGETDKQRKGMREKAGLPRDRRGGRPKSMEVLGGMYLDGSRERRRHSSVDST